VKLKDLEVRTVYEFRPEDYDQEFWQQYRGEKTKPKIVIYQCKDKFLLALKINGTIFPRWKAIASLVKFCCMIERTNTQNIKTLKQAFYEQGLTIEELQPTLFSKEAKP
jgi:hypothetical protein